MKNLKIVKAFVVFAFVKTATALYYGLRKKTESKEHFREKDEITGDIDNGEQEYTETLETQIIASSRALLSESMASGIKHEEHDEDDDDEDEDDEVDNDDGNVDDDGDIYIYSDSDNTKDGIEINTNVIENQTKPQSGSLNNIYMKHTLPKGLPSETPIEFEYLYALFNYRISQLSYKNERDDVCEIAGFGEEPSFPDFEKWGRPLRRFIRQKLNNDKDKALLLLTALTPFAVPELFEDGLACLKGRENEKAESNEWSIIGGIHGKNFRGFLPTGQTVLFLLDHNEYESRIRLQALFDADQYLIKNRIIWLDDVSSGEPYYHGRLVISQDYVEYFLFGAFKPPLFGPNFPACKLETELQWKDLIINSETATQIMDIKSWIRNNEQMVSDWNMGNRFRKGYRAMFYGPSGTGKTLSAGLLGKYAFEDDTELECTEETTQPVKRKDVYKIDLSMIVSKYIGETEKNLELLFVRAEDKGWILFFDEADALFGKRTNVRDAHDKYANQEVSYLLQRIENYDGLIILATNMKTNIDEAFIRRFDSIVKFSLPTAEERVKIWRRIFPENVFFVEKDYDFACHQKPVSFNIYPRIKDYELSGGSILNVVQYASLKGFERAQANISRYIRVYHSSMGEEIFDDPEGSHNKTLPVIYLQDVIDGIRREMVKEGKPFV